MMSDSKQEDEKRKMLADLVAEYRNDADAMDRGELYQPTTEYLRRLLDRIEAAWEREREHVGKTDMLGNMAKMREALVLCLQIIGENGIRGNVFTDDIREAHRAITAALSAPARNCDLYSNAKEALKAHEEAFDEENFKNGECRLGCPDCDRYYAIRCEIKWLFAPAAERKGEGDGSK